jgi:hypothetical protein
MEVKVDSDWLKRPINLNLGYNQNENFRWYTKEEWSNIRQDPRGYWCHDAALIREINGSFEVMICVRSLTGQIKDGFEVHSTPIEGWLWFPGGRNLNNCLPSPDFDPANPSDLDIKSLLTVLSRETGLSKEDCIAAWNLGRGKAFYPSDDIYWRNDYGIEFTMEHPQFTHSAIYVVQVDNDFLPKGKSVENVTWITEKDYQNMKSEFCSYMQDCLNSLFAGLNK